MNLRFLAAASLVVFTVSAAAQWADKPVTRPRITGISHIAVYASDPAATDHYYTEIIGALKLPDPENPKGVKYALSATQYIEVLPLPADAGVNRLDHTAWNTDDAEALRRFLGSKAWKVPGQVEKGADGSRWFAVKDAEGNKVEFVQPPERRQQLNLPAAVGTHIIHVGFMVHSRAVEDTFYRDLLGFKPYWFGGMVEGKLDWVSQQSPDSTTGWNTCSPAVRLDREFRPRCRSSSWACLTISPSAKSQWTWPTESWRRQPARGPSRRAHADRQGRQGPVHLYDPDGIRLELMNFHASQKPCCSPFTADDPAE